jgi:fatty-acyl-CoA synthase
VENGETGEAVVLLVQYRVLNSSARRAFARRLTARIRSEFAIDCQVQLVGPHALPRTSSGKPSRSLARLNYLAGASNTDIPAAPNGLAATAHAR